MINISLLRRTSGKYPSIQVRERSAWVRDFPDVPRSCLNASGIPDWWKVGICVREIATGVGSALQQRENQAARRQFITRAIHACCSGSRRSAYGDQPRLRSAIDTSAATALSETLKPALRRPLGVSTKTRRRRDIRLTLRTVSNDRRLEIKHRMEWEPAPSEPARVICRKAQLFSKSLLELLHRKNLIGTECPLLALSGTSSVATHMSAFGVRADIPPLTSLV